MREFSSILPSIRSYGELPVRRMKEGGDGEERRHAHHHIHAMREERDLADYEH